MMSNVHLFTHKSNQFYQHKFVQGRQLAWLKAEYASLPSRGFDCIEAGALAAVAVSILCRIETLALPFLTSKLNLIF